MIALFAAKKERLKPLLQVLFESEILTTYLNISILKTMYLAGEPLIRHCSLNTQGASFFSKNMGISMYKHVKSCTNMYHPPDVPAESTFNAACQTHNKKLCPKSVTFCYRLLLVVTFCHPEHCAGRTIVSYFSS